jgi:hypothetical protein
MRQEEGAIADFSCAQTRHDKIVARPMLIATIRGLGVMRLCIENRNQLSKRSLIWTVVLYPRCYPMIGPRTRIMGTAPAKRFVMKQNKTTQVKELVIKSVNR